MTTTYGPGNSDSCTPKSCLAARFAWSTCKLAVNDDDRIDGRVQGGNGAVECVERHEFGLDPSADVVIDGEVMSFERRGVVLQRAPFAVAMKESKFSVNGMRAREIETSATLQHRRNCR